MQIAVCDDQAEARLNLVYILEGLQEEGADITQIYQFSSGPGLLGWLDKHRGEIDLVFLDIQMGDMDGMEAARRLRALDGGLQIAFVTGYSDYVFDGYEVGALGYVLKPAKRPQVEDILRRAAAALLRHQDEVFLCRSGDICYRVPKDEIIYFASDKRRVQCHTSQRVYTFYDRLDRLEQELADGSFVRVHQRYLVHAPFVAQVTAGEVLLTTGIALPISRSCQSAALLSLTNALLR